MTMVPVFAADALEVLCGRVRGLTLGVGDSGSAERQELFPPHFQGPEQ